MDSRSLGAGLVFVFFASLGCGTFGNPTAEVEDDNFRDDVIECEDAASHIQECCPGATSLPDCHYSRVDYTCGSWPYKSVVASSVTDHPLAEDQSDAIRNEDCAALVADGTCGKEWPSNATPPVEPAGSYDCGPCGC